MKIADLFIKRWNYGNGPLQFKHYLLKSIVRSFTRFPLLKPNRESKKKQKKTVKSTKQYITSTKKQALQSVDETCCESGANVKHQAAEVNENTILPLSDLAQGFICSVREAGGETLGPAHEANTLGCVQAKLTHTHCCRPAGGVRAGVNGALVLNPCWIAVPYLNLKTERPIKQLWGTRPTLQTLDTS